MLQGGRAGTVNNLDPGARLTAQVLAGSHIQWMLMPRQKGSGSLGGQGGGDPSDEKPNKPPKKPRKPNPSKATDKDQQADHGAVPNAADKPTKLCRGRVAPVSSLSSSRSGIMTALLHRMSPTCAGLGFECRHAAISWRPAATVFEWMSERSCLLCGLP